METPEKPVRRLVMFSWTMETVSAIGVTAVTAKLATSVLERDTSRVSALESGAIAGVVIGVLLALAACRIQCDSSSLRLVNTASVVTLPWGAVHSLQADGAFEVIDTDGISYISQVFGRPGSRASGTTSGSSTSSERAVRKICTWRSRNGLADVRHGNRPVDTSRFRIGLLGYVAAGVLYGLIVAAVANFS